ncbi:MAG: hypothetical protein JNM78_10755 [Cyclobacteriaceae bacterium]|nr:hypothetical protein [Cyclobacteriaceae bacterium]
MPAFQHQQDVFLLTKMILPACRSTAGRPAHRNGCAGGLLIPAGHA